MREKPDKIFREPGEEFLVFCDGCLSFVPNSCYIRKHELCEWCIKEEVSKDERK